jgi:hypothetical protein
MFERMKVRKSVAAAGVAVIAAMGLGGAAIAQPGASPTASQPGSPVVQNERAAPESSATDRDNVQDENGRDDATERSEAAEGPEQAEKGEAPEGKEVPGDDGPGGHADEPGNPNADHQFQGKE